MGYTHYFRQHKILNENEWTSIYEAYQKILNEYSEIIEDSSSNINPEKYINFNGIEEDAHENFMITNYSCPSFNFCKTARKEYDIVVCLFLLYINENHSGILEISSDGDWDEWMSARQEYKRIFNKIPNCPWDSTEEEDE